MEFLGEYDSVRAVTGTMVYPQVAMLNLAISQEDLLNASSFSNEVQRVFHVTVDELTPIESRPKETLEGGFRSPLIDLEGKPVVWGLTASILDTFLVECLFPLRHASKM